MSHTDSQSQQVRNESGSVLTIVAVVVVALLGFAGLTIDAGYAFLEKAKLQSLADALALACAQYECQDDPGASNVNTQLFAPLETSFDMQHIQVSVNTPVACPDGDDGCTQVQVHKEWNTFFIRLLGKKTMALNVVAIAKGGLAAEEPELIFGLEPTVMAFDAGGSGISVVRQNADAGYVLSGQIISNSASGVTANTGWLMPNAQISGEIRTVGPVSSNFSLASGTTVTTIPSSQPIANPCPANLPPSAPQFCNWNSIPCKSVPTCNTNNQVIDVLPGAYGNFNFAQSNGLHGCHFKLKPGVYTLLSSFAINLNGKDAVIDGSDVTLVTGNINAVNLGIKGSGGHEVNLRAPTSGDLAGVLIWHTGHNQSLFLNYGNQLTGNPSKPASAVRFDGVYYVPNGTLRVQSEGGLLASGSTSLPTETRFSGLIAPQVEMNAYNTSRVSVVPPSMGGVCSLESSGSGGSGSGGSGSGQTGHHGKSRLVN